MGLFGKKKEEKSCCCGDSCTPEKMAQADEAALSYLGIALCGNKKKMNKLTGSLPLLR